MHMKNTFLQFIIGLDIQKTYLFPYAIADDNVIVETRACIIFSVICDLFCSRILLIKSCFNKIIKSMICYYGFLLGLNKI